jgi:hypothetical protein
MRNYILNIHVLNSTNPDPCREPKNKGFDFNKKISNSCALEFSITDKCYKVADISVFGYDD